YTTLFRSAAEGCALGLHALPAGGRDLPGGEPIDLIVHHEVGEIDVAAHDVHEVVPADAEAVPIAARNHHLETMVAELGSGRDGQRAAVERMHAVGVDVARQVGGAADSADGEDLV